MAIFDSRRRRRAGNRKPNEPEATTEPQPEPAPKKDIDFVSLLQSQPKGEGTTRSLAELVTGLDSSAAGREERAAKPAEPTSGSGEPKATETAAKAAPTPAPPPVAGKKKETTVATIGKSTTVKGDITGSEDLVVNGTVEGTISLPDHELTVGAEGTVTADVKAKTIHVIGQVSGNVVASDLVEVETDGIIGGDIQSPRLMIQDGAIVNGSVLMSKPAKGSEDRPRMKKVDPAPKTSSEQETG